MNKLTAHHFLYPILAAIVIFCGLAWLRAHDAWKDFQADKRVAEEKIKTNNAAVTKNDATVATAQKTVEAGTASNAKIDNNTAAELAKVKQQLASKPDSAEIQAMLKAAIPGLALQQSKDAGGNAVLAVADTQANRDLLNQVDADFKSCKFDRDGCEAKNKNFTEVIVPALNTQIQALNGTIAAKNDTIAQREKELKAATSFGKGGNIWSRTGRVLIPIGCAGAGAFLGANKGTKGAAIGALAGGSVCAIAFHF